MKSPEELVNQYSDMVYRIALAETRRREDADDVFQEVFLSVMRRTEEFADEEHEKAWLIRATLSLAKKQYTSAFERHRAELIEEAVSDEAEGVAAIYEMTGEETEVYEAVLSLPEQYRIAIHLFYYEEYAIREIADIMQLKEGTVKSLLSRGRNLLREAMAS